MKPHRNTLCSGAGNNIRKRLLSGLFLLLPFVITLTVVYWLFQWVSGFFRPLFVYVLNKLIQHHFFDSVPDAYIKLGTSVLSIIIFLSVLYVIGAIGQFVIGKRLLRATETIVLKIPMVRTIYSAAKQVIQAVSLPERTAFKSVVLVDFPRKGIKAVGFFTGYIEDAEGKTLCKVFIPTTPNPTTGFFEIIPPEEVAFSTLTIEDAFKMIISGGLVSPSIITTRSFPDVQPTEQPEMPQPVKISQNSP